MPARPQLLGLVGIRKGLERIFSPHDLSWLDGPLPGPGAAGKHRRERPEQGSGAEEVGAVLRASLGHSRPGAEPPARGAPGVGAVLATKPLLPPQCELMQRPGPQINLSVN